MRFFFAAIVAGSLLIACNSTGLEAPTQSPTAAQPGSLTPIPTAPPSGTATVSLTACPVDAATCAAALPFIEAWERSDVDALMALAKPLKTRCPVPRPSGLGGPYPLCDGATVQGEARQGYVWSSGSHGGLTGAAGHQENLERYVKSHGSVLSIGCELVPGGGVCRGDFSLVFGPPDAARAGMVVLLPVVRDDGVGLIGVIPVLGVTCANGQSGRDCALVNGGTVAGMGLRYWGDESQRPADLPDWTFFRWEP